LHPFDRGMLLIYVLAGTIGAVCCGAMISGVFWPQEYADRIYKAPGFYETAYAILAVYLVIGLRLAWISLHTGKKHAVVQEGSMGQVRIALDAIESLVVKVVLDQKGIKEARAGVEKSANGISIRVKTTVAPDINIPHLSESLQALIGQSVKEVTGIDVQSVKIEVNNISAQKLRVE